MDQTMFSLLIHQCLRVWPSPMTIGDYDNVHARSANALGLTCLPASLSCRERIGKERPESALVTVHSRHKMPTARFSIASSLFCRSISSIVFGDLGDCGGSACGAPGDPTFSGSVDAATPSLPPSLYPGEFTA